MTAVNGTLDGMPNTSESAILAASVEAVEWKHPIEQISEEGKRKTPRVIIYPVEMPQLEEEMNEFLQDPSELEDGKHIAYSKILEKCAEFESSPRFFREDSSELLSDPEFATVIPSWMNIAAQTSVGGRDLILENGPDTMNSDDEESLKEEHGEVLTGMYTNGLKAPVLLSQSEVAHQMAVASYAKSVGYGKWISSDTQPVTSGTEFRDSDLSRSQSIPNLSASSMGGGQDLRPAIRLNSPNR
jgi:hypothetical protein